MYYTQNHAFKYIYSSYKGGPTLYLIQLELLEDKYIHPTPTEHELMLHMPSCTTTTTTTTYICLICTAYLQYCLLIPDPSALTQTIQASSRLSILKMRICPGSLINGLSYVVYTFYLSKLIHWRIRETYSQIIYAPIYSHSKFQENILRK